MPWSRSVIGGGTRRGLAPVAGNAEDGLLEQKAAYLHFTDSAAAQQLLAKAGRENGFVLRQPLRPSLVFWRPERSRYGRRTVRPIYVVGGEFITALAQGLDGPFFASTWESGDWSSPHR